jgi:hypothetical protein
MYTDTRESDRLTLVLEIALEIDCIKICILSSECLDLDLELYRTFLKSILALQCFSYSQGNLMVAVHEACVTIDEDGASCELLLGLLFPKGGRLAARQAGHVHIEMDHVTWDCCGVVQVAFACVKNFHCRRHRTTSLSQAASSTLRFWKI